MLYKETHKHTKRHYPFVIKISSKEKKETWKSGRLTEK